MLGTLLVALGVMLVTIAITALYYRQKVSRWTTDTAEQVADILHSGDFSQRLESGQPFSQP